MKIEEDTILTEEEKKSIKYISSESYFKYLKEKSKDKNKDNFKESKILKEQSEQYNCEKVNKKHDKPFKDLLSHKEVAVDFINKCLGLREKLRADDLERHSTEYITSSYKSKEADIVYKIKNRKIFILIEQQTTEDVTMPYRIRSYANEIIKQEVEKDKIKNRAYIYPTVIPIVIYTGKRKWNVSQKLKNIEDKLEGYEEIVDYNLVDVNKINEKELLEDECIISKAMLIEKSKSKEEIIRNAEQIATKIYKENNEIGKYFLEVLTKYILTGRTKEQVIKIIERIENEEGGEAEMLNCVRVIKEEEAAIRRKGLKEGRISGLREKAKEIAKALLKENMTTSKISDITGLKIEEIENIKRQK